MRYCLVKGCSSKYSIHQTSNKIAFFSFPKDPKLHQAWVNVIMHSNNQAIELVADSRICEKHFASESVFFHNCRTTLLKGSVPTIFPNSDVEYLLSEEEQNVVDPTVFFDSDEEHLLPEEENVVDLTNFADRQMSTLVLPKKATELSGSEIQATDFFLCENCGHKNHRDRLIKSRKRRNSGNGCDESTETPKKFISSNEYEQRSPNFLAQPINQVTHFPCKATNLYRPNVPQKFMSSSGGNDPIVLDQSIDQEWLSSYGATHNADFNRSNVIVQPSEATMSSCLPQQNQTNAEVQPTPKSRPRRLYFPGDIADDADLTPRSSKKFIASLKKVVTKQSRKIKVTAQKVRRQHKRILTMKTLLDDLKNKKMISDNALELLQVNRCGENVFVDVCAIKSVFL